MSWADDYQIDTPEQVDLDVDVAGPGSRFVAEFVDACIKFLLALAVIIPAACLGALVPDRDTGVSPLALALLVAVLVVIVYGYDVYFEGYRDGQTPGKKYADIRVVSENGGPIDLRQALIRNLVGFADFLPVAYLLGAVVMMLNRRAQRLGDLAAGTVVLRVRRGGLADDVESRILAAADPEIVLLPEQLARCNPQDLHVLHSFFARLKELDRPSRFRLGLRLLDTMLQRTGYEPPRPLAEEGRTEAFLASLYRDLKAYRQHG